MAPKGSQQGRAGGGSIWDDAAFLKDLAVALYEAANQAGGLGPAVKASIEHFVQQQGHDSSWDRIR